MGRVPNEIPILRVNVVGFEAFAFDVGDSGTMGDQFDEEDEEDGHHRHAQGPGVVSPDLRETLVPESFDTWSKQLILEVKVRHDGQLFAPHDEPRRKGRTRTYMDEGGGDDDP